MPIYEYACDSCSQRFEKLVSGLDAPVACPHCESSQLKRLPSVFSSSTGGSSAPAPMDMGGGCGRCGSSVPGQCNLN